MQISYDDIRTFVPVLGTFLVSIIILVIVYRWKKNSFYFYHLLTTMLILNVVLNYDLTFRVLGLVGEENTGMAAFLGVVMVISVAIVSLLFIKKPIDIIEDITRVAKDISNGDLTSKLAKSLRLFKEFEDLVDKVNATTNNLSKAN